VGHLAHEYGVPLVRAHIIGHDQVQVPGITPANVVGMHWHPEPYWDWEHCMSLLGHPISGDRHADGRVVTVRPRFADNEQPVTGCDADGTCPVQGDEDVGDAVAEPDLVVRVVPDDVGAVQGLARLDRVLQGRRT
jgi:hypothetical protein